MGGFAKVAAGVLAAGTIASGGTAIQHRDDPLPVTDAKADVAAAAVRGGRRTRPARLYIASTPRHESYAVSTFGSGGTRCSGGRRPRAGRRRRPRAAFDGPGVDANAAEEPVARASRTRFCRSTLGCRSKARPRNEPTQEEPAANEGETGEPQSGDPSDPASGPVRGAAARPERADGRLEPGRRAWRLRTCPSYVWLAAA